MNVSGPGPQRWERAMDRIAPYLRRWETLLLVTLLVVIAVIALLVSLLVPSLKVA